MSDAPEGRGASPPPGRRAVQVAAATRVATSRASAIGRTEIGGRAGGEDGRDDGTGAFLAATLCRRD
ncbi:MAG: hypothetical protein HY815_24365 [Candidatus Riflebacteria bacterium]|nr:hypothetical protein [Candidatus Riflebacteria bacterium]